MQPNMGPSRFTRIVRSQTPTSSPVISRSRPRSAGSESAALRAYIEQLRAYLNQRGVPLIDFTTESRLGEDLYVDGDHLSRAGRAVFTALLADSLAPYLERPDGGSQ